MRARALPPARRHGCVLAPPSVGLGALRAIVGGRVHDPNWRRLFHGCTVGRLQERTPPRSTWAPLCRGPRESSRAAIMGAPRELCGRKSRNKIVSHQKHRSETDSTLVGPHTYHVSTRHTKAGILPRTLAETRSISWLFRDLLYVYTFQMDRTLTRGLLTKSPSDLPTPSPTRLAQATPQAEGGSPPPSRAQVRSPGPCARRGGRGACHPSGATSPAAPTPAPRVPS